MSHGTTEQPSPTGDECKPDIADLVIEDMKARKAVGIQRYGQALKPFNGRDALVDAYQEALDLAVYLRQAIEERPSCSEVKVDGIVEVKISPGS